MRAFITDPAVRGGLRRADDVPEPQPRPDQLLLEVRAYAINPGEAALIKARPDGWRPGQDVAGVVLRAAADGTGPRGGARVVAVVDGEGWADRAAVPARWAVEIADSVSFEQAAALPIAGVTALRALRTGGSVLGREVLVTGSTGGVGHLAVQLAVASGARVTALVSRPEREGDARALGAHRVVTSVDGDAGPFHLVLDGVGGPVLARALHRTVAEGTVVLYGFIRGSTEISLLDFAASAQNARVIGFFHATPAETKGEDLAILAGLVADGRLVPRLGLVRDWRETADAFAGLAAGEVQGQAVLIRSE
jgi:NADPH2:quinone reductase